MGRITKHHRKTVYISWRIQNGPLRPKRCSALTKIFFGRRIYEGVRMCLWRPISIYEAPAKPSCRAGDWAQGLPHAERVWYHYTNCPLQAEAPRGAQKALFFRLWARVFLALCFLIGVCCVSSFLVLCGGVSAFVVRGACTYGSLLEPAPTALMSALTKMYLWRRRCIYEGVSADEDVFIMKPKMYSWRCQRWRRCIYEGEDVFMKASALTKMYLWRRRCIHEGVRADKDVFMKAKMYLWRCQCWQRCIHDGEDVFLTVSLLTKMYLWMKVKVSALTKMYLWRAHADVFMKAKMYLWRCQRWRRCILYDGEDVFMKVSALTKMYLWSEDVFIKASPWRRCICANYEGEDVFMKVSALTKMYLWRRRCIFMKVSALTKMYLWRRRCIHEGVSADEDVFMKRRCVYQGITLTKMYLC